MKKKLIILVIVELVLTLTLWSKSELVSSQIDRAYQVSYRVLKSNLELSKEGKKGYRYDMGIYIVSDVELTGKFRGNTKNPSLKVLSVAKGSPAEKAGILVGDRLLKLNNRSIRETPITYSDQFPTVRHRFYFLVNKYYSKNGSVNITLERNEVEHKLNIIPELICNVEPNILISDKFEAYVVGKAIFVTTKIIEVLADDSKLALIIGHELAHITLFHFEKKVAVSSVMGSLIGAAVPGGAIVKQIATRAGSTVGSMAFSHKYELEADYVGLYHTARAGYHFQDAVDFFRNLAQAELAIAGHSKATLSHPSSIERFSKLKETVKEIEDKIAENPSQSLWPEN